MKNSPNTHILTIRSHTGISGDILLAGLGSLLLQQRDIKPDSPEGDTYLSDLCRRLMPELAGALKIRPKFRTHIKGWQAEVTLPHAHEHRNLAAIDKIISDSALSDAAKADSMRCFELLAKCEAAAHGIELSEVHFHEVGALDSILDVCASCQIYDELKRPDLICSPLPLCDGEIRCAHGFLPAPAPATLYLLKNIPVQPFAGACKAGELLTPTGIALLLALEAKFGPWPHFRLEDSALVYGQREFADVANGVIFALGYPSFAHTSAHHSPDASLEDTSGSPQSL